MTLSECLEKHGIKDVRCGAECGDGWVPIIDAFLTLAGNNDYVVGQLKEKFGTLRFYWHGEPVGEGKVDDVWYDIANALESYAEHTSSFTCERCGKDGELRTKGWMWTLCDECEEKRANAH